MDRRKFLGSSTLLGLTAATASQVASARLPLTPSEAEGPFYPLVAQKDRDFDLTRIEGRDGTAQGTQIYIEGKVVDQHGNPVEGATVDLWQANTFGRYRHPFDPNTAPLDDNFQGWAIVQSGKQGGFRLKTIIPGAYPASSNWTRPPHIHFKISKSGYHELTTQMYFPDMPLNNNDRLLLSKAESERPLMIASKSEQQSDNLDVYHYQIVMNRI